MPHLPRLWNVTTRECTATLREHTGSVHCVAVSADGKNIASRCILAVRCVVRIMLVGKTGQVIMMARPSYQGAST